MKLTILLDSVAIAEKKAAAAAVQAVMEHPPEATKEDDQKEAEKPKDKEKDELNTSLDELDVALHRVALEPSVLFKGRPMYIIVRASFLATSTSLISNFVLSIICASDIGALKRKRTRFNFMVA